MKSSSLKRIFYILQAYLASESEDSEPDEAAQAKYRALLAGDGSGNANSRKGGKGWGAAADDDDDSEQVQVSPFFAH